MLGLFINTLPVIQSPEPQQTVGAWLRTLQAGNLAMREHEHVPLYELQRWAGRPGEALFDSILVFENYPLDEALRARIRTALNIGALTSVGPTHYALTVSVEETRDQAAIAFSYWREQFAPAQIEACSATGTGSWRA